MTKAEILARADMYEQLARTATDIQIANVTTGGVGILPSAAERHLEMASILRRAATMVA